MCLMPVHGVKSGVLLPARTHFIAVLHGYTELLPTIHNSIKFISTKLIITSTSTLVKCVILVHNKTNCRPKLIILTICKLTGLILKVYELQTLVTLQEM